MLRLPCRVQMHEVHATVGPLFAAAAIPALGQLDVDVRQALAGACRRPAVGRAATALGLAQAADASVVVRGARLAPEHDREAVQVRAAQLVACTYRGLIHRGQRRVQYEGYASYASNDRQGKGGDSGLQEQVCRMTSEAGPSLSFTKPAPYLFPSSLAPPSPVFVAPFVSWSASLAAGRSVNETFCFFRELIPVSS